MPNTTFPIADDSADEAPPDVVEISGSTDPPPLQRNRQRAVVRRSTDLPNQEDPLRTRRDKKDLVFKTLLGGLASAVIHLLLLISLGICVLAASEFGEPISIEVIEADDTDLLEEELLDELAIDIEPLPTEDLAEPEEASWDSEVFDQKEDLVSVDMDDFLTKVTQEGLDKGAFAARTGLGDGHSDHQHPGRDLASRAKRRQHALAYGASVESENAVELALEWFARHQRRDGSWCFNHRMGDHSCEACQCANPGDQPMAQALNGATAMVLLAYLGAGYTHLEGQYQEQVAAGLRYLTRAQESDGSFLETQGQMYSHGLATLALCEALAMTRYDYHKSNALLRVPDTTIVDPDRLDREAASKRVAVIGDRFPDDAALLQTSGMASAEESGEIGLGELPRAAQLGINFIEKAQHYRGGWRYKPRQPGDTSVVGWQMMALKSGYLAGLDVNPRTIKKAVGFLDSVSNDQVGSCYGYTSRRQHGTTTTSIGLLCRMYTGWDHSERGLAMGVAGLETCAEPGRGMYFYYYATQVMHHYRGPAWQGWNAWMRDYLVSTQNRKGSEAGSWSFTRSCDHVGRLYCTAMAAMTLEVYYRYSPIYSSAAVTTAHGVD